jgi:hypothetical protein
MYKAAAEIYLSGLKPGPTQIVAFSRVVLRGDALQGAYV